MGTKLSGVWPADNEPSWTDETLPLDVRHGLLDRALDRIKADKRPGPGHPASQHPASQDEPDHPGEPGPESSDRGD